MLDAEKIREMLGEKPWPGYEQLHEIVHSRLGSIFYYLKNPVADESRLFLGPNPKDFAKPATAISSFAMMTCYILAHSWQVADREWEQKFRHLWGRLEPLIKQAYGA